MFCKYCGNELGENADFCVKCGRMTDKCQGGKIGANGVAVQDANLSKKSRVVAGLLGIFLGEFGAHNFYVGKVGRGLCQLLLTLFGGFFVFMIAVFSGSIVGAEIWIGLSALGLSMIFVVPFAVGVWAFIEAICCFVGTYEDSEGKKLS